MQLVNRSLKWTKYIGHGMEMQATNADFLTVIDVLDVYTNYEIGTN